MQGNSNQIADKANEKLQHGFMGLLMLDTNFPRYLGDIGNPQTFDFPVRKIIVSGASPEAIICKVPEIFLEPFIKAAKQFEQDGARIISTSCGFLTVFQNELQNAVNIPVLTSSLFLFNASQRSIAPTLRLGILTIAASSLTKRHLAAARIPQDTPIGTTETGKEFTRSILENRSTLDRSLAEEDVVAAALSLQKETPALGGILLECTNMPPYADAVRQATGLPVWSINDGLNALWHGKPSTV